MTSIIRAAVVLVAATSGGGACGLIDAFGGDLRCDGDQCRCAVPAEGTEDAVCFGGPDVCTCVDGGNLNCANADVPCEVRLGQDCFNAFCDCEAENRDEEGANCSCGDDPGFCTSLDPGNEIETEDFSCFGICSCGPGLLGSACFCLGGGALGVPEPDCLMDAEGATCSGDIDCDIIARAEGLGCDPALATDNDCGPGERCVAHPLDPSFPGICFRTETNGCQAGYVPESHPIEGDLCLREVSRETPVCINRRCGPLPPPPPPP